MREINSETVVEKLKCAIDYALTHVDPDVIKLLKKAALLEEGLAKWALEKLVENDELCERTRAYPCQDTGLSVIFADVGEDVHVSGLEDAINEAVRLAYKDARKSVAHPLTRLNTGDNTPAVIHTRIVKGDKLNIGFLAKGAGSENMSRIYMLPPSSGREGIIKSVVDCVSIAGANPCPPIILGIGIGGTLEQCAVNAKRALLLSPLKPADDEIIGALEKDITDAVNNIGIGAQGFGGKVTALYVKAVATHTHIGMLPVAVNVQCHSARHACVEI